jgi:hypothetical protein
MSIRILSQSLSRNLIFLLAAAQICPGSVLAGGDQVAKKRKGLNYFQLSTIDQRSQEQIAKKTSVPDLNAVIIDDNYLVPEDVAESTSDSHKVLRARNQDHTVNEVQAQYTAIKQGEKEIKRLHDSLVADHLTSEDLYQKVILPLNNKLDVDHSEVDRYLTQWEERNSAFHHARYQLIKEKQNYFTDLLYRSLHAEVDRYRAKKGKWSKSAEQILAEIDSAYLKWQSLREIIGEDAHPQYQNHRMYALADVHAGARKLMIKMGKADKLPFPIVTSFQKRKVLSGGIKTAATVVKIMGLLIAGNYPKAQRGKQRLDTQGNLIQNDTPLTTKVGGGFNALFKNLAEFQGYNIKVEGQRNLELVPLNGSSDPERKIINFFLPPHRNDMLDGMSMANLGLPHYMIFANAKMAVPDLLGLPLSKMAAARTDLISVGPEKGYLLEGQEFAFETPAKFLKSVNEKISANALNYPQGLISNFGEILNINPNFRSKLLKMKLMEKLPLAPENEEKNKRIDAFNLSMESKIKDYNEKVQKNLVPIVYETDSRGLAYNGSADDRNVTVKIMAPVKFDALKLLIAKEEQDERAGKKSYYINSFMNSVWYENIKKHPELTLDEMMDRAEMNLGLKLKTE